MRSHANLCGWRGAPGGLDLAAACLLEREVPSKTAEGVRPVQQTALLTVAAIVSEFAAEFDEAGRRRVVEDAEEVVTFFGRQFEGRVLSGESSFDSVGECEVWVAADLEE
jgi:hypothetical protein